MSRRGIRCTICGATCSCRNAAQSICCSCHRHTARRRAASSTAEPRIVHIGRFVQSELGDPVLRGVIDAATTSEQVPTERCPYCPGVMAGVIEDGRVVGYRCRSCGRVLVAIS